MAYWFLDDLERLNRERESIDELHSTNNWFINYEWILDPQLKLNATIQVNEHQYQIAVTYPTHYPFVPIIVRPLDNEVRWSTHQYLDGTLCLEYGPDTWDSNLTGADMISSAFRLLDVERPHDSDTMSVAPSRHQLSIGQQLRQNYCRLCVTDSLNNFVRGLSTGTIGELTLSFQINKSSSSIITKSINLSDGTSWHDPEVPEGVKETSNLSAKLFCLPTEDILNSDIRNKDELYQFLLKYSLTGKSTDKGAFSLPDIALLIGEGDTMRGYFVPSANENASIVPVELVNSQSSVLNPRLPYNIQETNEKKIGIVGLGSIGSKVAVSLARSGFKDFVLIDHDIFLVENIVRNQLDWLSVGDHKVDAVAANIERISPNSDIKIHKLDLTGQENNASINNAMKSLSRCSIMIDATGNDSVFNILSGLYSQNHIPIVWGQVFEGGFGGLIARSRPLKDPPPMMMRKIFLGYCEDHPFPVKDFETSAYEGVVDDMLMIASDADVATIASLLTSFAVDTSLNVEPSRYPYSIYLVGLSQGWVFDAPFETIPISTSEHSQEKPVSQESPEVRQSTVKFLSELLDQADAKNTNTTADN